MAEKQTIHQAFVEVCGKVENVKRDTVGQVGNQKYKYATIDAVLDITQALLYKNGLALSQVVMGDSLVATLYHESGTSLPMGEYNLGAFIDSQKRGSAITYGRRYQLCGIFGIAQEDDDGAEASKKSNTPTSGDKTAQAVFGTAAKFKEYYNDTSDAIKRMTLKEQASVLQARIAKIESVDEQSAMNLQDLLSLRLDELHMQN